LNGCVHDELHTGLCHGSNVGCFAVQQLEGFEDVEVVLLETGHDRLHLESLEMRAQARPNVGQQAFEDAACALSSSAV
jgi:hypothetical protein